MNLIVQQTDKGHYAVRPAEWGGIYKDGKIKEYGLTHTAIFADGRYAREYVDLVNRDEPAEPLYAPIWVGEQARKAKEKGIQNFMTYKCPMCKTIVRESGIVPKFVVPNFCKQCGQRLKQVEDVKYGEYV